MYNMLDDTGEKHNFDLSKIEKSTIKVFTSSILVDHTVSLQLSLLLLFSLLFTLNLVFIRILL